MLKLTLTRRAEFELVVSSLRSFSRSVGAPPILSIKKNEGDPTLYRIPLAHEDEDLLFNATRGSQWSMGPRPRAPNWLFRASVAKLKVQTKTQNIKGFNYDNLNRLEKDALRQFSEFNHYLPFQDVDNLYVRMSQSYKSVQRNLRFNHAQKENLDKLTGRGKSHIFNVGKSYGPPRRLNEDGSMSSEYDTRFNSKVLQWEYRTHYFSKGKYGGFRVTVAVGNGKGLMGVGMTFHQNINDALLEAKQYAYQQLVHFPMTESGSIPYSKRGRFHGTELSANPVNPLQENKAQWLVKCLLELAGYKGVAVKLYGRNNPESICKAFILTFSNFESHQEQADKMGRYVVKFDPKNHFAPQILAKPKEGTIPMPYSAEIHDHSES